ncbi:MAG: hypothetical protein U0794_21880 [Isosphaeraceae bacterium]
MPPDEAVRQAQLEAEAADLVLEDSAQRLDQLEPELGREAADVGGVDRRGRPVRVAAALDDVGVERALGEEARGLIERALSLNTSGYEGVPDLDPLSCGSVTPLSRRER